MQFKMCGIGFFLAAKHTLFTFLIKPEKWAGKATYPAINRNVPRLFVALPVILRIEFFGAESALEYLAIRTGAGGARRVEVLVTVMMMATTAAASMMETRIFQPSGRNRECRGAEESKDSWLEALS